MSKAKPIADRIEEYCCLMTAQQLAELLGESVKTLYARVSRGAMPAVRIGGAVKFDPVKTAIWLREQSA
jgi:excisionase family DNA binding protein